MAIAPPRIQFKTASFTVNEAAGTATITITRTGGSDVAERASSLRVRRHRHADGRLSRPRFNSLFSLLAGCYDVTFTIPIVNDAEVESPETVRAQPGQQRRGTPGSDRTPPRR